MRLIGRLMALAIAVAILVMAGPGASGADDAGDLVDPPGGFSLAGADSVCMAFDLDATETVVYEGVITGTDGDTSGCLELSAYEAIGTSVDDMLSLHAELLRMLDPQPDPVDDPPGGLMFQTGSGPARVTTLAFPGPSHVYLFHLLTTSTVPDDAVRELLSDIAGRQLAADDEAPAVAPSADETPAAPELTESTGDPELASLLVNVPAELGESLMGPFSLAYQPIEVGPDQERLAAVLDRRTIRANATWLSDPSLTAPDAPTRAYSIAIERYPFERFAAAVLGLDATIPDAVPVALSPGDLPPDAVAIRQPANTGSGTTTQIVFRRGRTVVTVMVAGLDAADRQQDQLAAELARAQAAALPFGGATAPYYFPSEPVGNLVTLAVASAVGLLVPLSGRTAARYRLPAAGPVPAPTAGIVDCRSVARRLRRRGWLIFAGQLLALNITVLGFIGTFAGYRGWVIGFVGVVAGLALTSWARRSDRVVIRRTMSLSALLASAVAGAMLIGGLSMAVGSLRDLAFGPSVTTMDRASSAAVSPESFAGLKAAGGLVLALVGAAASRLARARWRANAERLRALDPRPPALYLRSFEDDDVRLPSGFSGRQPFSEMLSLRGSAPFEEVIAWELSHRAPVTAVGRPGRRLTSLGAAREHLPNETWLRDVVERMAHASLLIVTIGATPGLVDELGQLVAGHHLNRVLFLFPPYQRDELARRWAFVAYQLARAGAVVPPLPADPGCILYAFVGPTIAAAVSDRRDEAAYQAGLRLMLDPPRPSSHLMVPPAFPAPGPGSRVDA